MLKMIFRTSRGIGLYATLLLALLTACDDREIEQRTAFIDFLQNTVLHSDGNLPELSENQRRSFGQYSNNYLILYRFSQYFNKTVEQNVIPTFKTLSLINTPQDYLLFRNQLSQVSGNLQQLTLYLRNAKAQVEKNREALNQPEDLRVVYASVYDYVVTQPVEALLPLMPELRTLSQLVIRTGDLIESQRGRVSFNYNHIQFSDANQATRYNVLMKSIAENQLVLIKLRRVLPLK